MEVVSVIAGAGEAWIEGTDGVAAIGPGDTLVLSPGVKHGFRVTGGAPLTTYGVHASSDRVVEWFPQMADPGAGAS